MAELICKNNCTEHEVQIDKQDKETLSNFIEGADYELSSVFFGEHSKKIYITLKERN